MPSYMHSTIYSPSDFLIGQTEAFEFVRTKRRKHGALPTVCACNDQGCSSRKEAAKKVVGT